MILVLAAWLVAGAAVFAAGRRMRRVNALATAADLTDGLERASRERLLGKLPEDAELGRVARDVLAAPGRIAGVAILNEALGDIVRELEVSAQVPRSAGRVSLATGGLFGLVELARRLPTEGAGSMTWAGSAFAGGLLGAFVCALLGRMAEQSARRCREGWDRLSRALERLLPEADVVKAAPRARVDLPRGSD